MRKRFCRLLPLATVLLTSAPTLAQAGNSRPPSSTDNNADYSKEAIVVERLSTRVVCERDGSGTRETTAVIRMQGEAGVRNFAVLSFSYTSDNEAVEVDHVRVRKPDGTVVLTPDQNIQDMPAEITRVAPIYSDIHERRVVVKALGVGDVLEYLVRYRTVKPRVPGQFWFEYTFVRDAIAKDETLEISIPSDKYLGVSSPELRPEVKEDGARRTYTWKTVNLERKDKELQTPQRDALQPSIQVATFRSWEEVGRWYGDLQRTQQTVTPQIQAKAALLTKGLTNDDDKIRALYNFVSTRFHYVSLSFGVGRYQPHRADEVLGNEYGDCKDKHTLLAALLKAAGYDAWPALINSSRKINSDVPSPGQFDHVITVVPRGAGLIWLDTTAEVAPFGLLLANLRDKQALVIPAQNAASLMKTPATPPFASSMSFSAEGKLNSDGTLTAHIERSARGDAEVLFRLGFQRVPAAQWKDLVQQISYASNFAGDVRSVTASIAENTDQPFRFGYDYTRKNYSDWENRRITPPLPPFGIEVATDGEKKPDDSVIPVSYTHLTLPTICSV